MNVMYAADDNYAEIMGISILSLLKSNKDVDDITFYLVEDRICDINKEKLSSMIRKYGRQITFITKPDIRGMLGTELRTLRWSDSAYSRLFLKDLFKGKPDIDKLLYLDCDTLIVGSLQKLWNTDISDWLGAACLECMSNMHKRIIGAKKKDNYVNTGMLLLNVKRWIEEDIQTVCGDFIRQHKGKTEYVDQGVINGSISNRFKLVSPRYNLTALAYDFTYEEMQIYRKPEFGYSKSEWEAAVKSPVVVHFTTSFLSIRPWYEGSKHPYAGMWKIIHDQSPWKEIPFRELNNRNNREKKEKIYRILPKGLAVWLAGALHSFVKPIIYILR